MNKELKKNLWHAVLVGIGSGILIGVYALLNAVGFVQQPLYWACFIVLPLVFMFGGKWSDVVPHIGNVWFGLLCGWCTFQLVNLMVGATGLPLAFGIATCIMTVVLQGITGGFLATSIGRCPMAFAGMVCCFAANGENLLVAVISLAVGIVCATLFVQSGALAAKLAGIKPEETPQA